MSAQTQVTRDTLQPAARARAGDESAAEAVAETLEHVRDTAGQLYRRAKDQALEKERRVEGYVQEHPWKSMLIAAGVGAGIGLLAGVLLARR
jgi:ElaB/YqjD/DUF883 family membrane-anchored ribosome-binding protein